MAQNRAAMEMLLETLDGRLARENRTDRVRASHWTRLLARLFAGRLDNNIERGTPVRLGSPLDVHRARITSFEERESLARSLRAVTWRAHAHGADLAFRLPVNRDAVLANAELIEDVALRLHAPLPVRSRGMARLRLLLADGCGPLYGGQHGPRRGSLAAQLRGVLAAL